ncbi:DUF6528 family protein [Paenibacillus sp. HJGM_3]|uniref:DUF6528 family protein n=1 Tax=Paenibacillus sp. HJGM_3 TaxID=3379816 RepID=UPI00385C15AA
MIKRLIASVLALILLLIAISLPASGAATATTSYDIVTTDQSGSGSILVFDRTAADWNAAGAVKWSWAPSASNGFASPTPGWGRPSDAKLRYNCLFGGYWMVVTDSYGLAAIVPYPAKNDKKWSINLGTGPNLHSAELLPNGNIAIAASTGGWVRVYTSSQGPTSTTNVQYALEAAHSVLWDPAGNQLWALGKNYLVALTIGGTASAPTLTEKLKIALPTLNGHDLQPVIGDPDRLWVSTGSAVYQYVKSTNSWSSTFAGASSISRVGVKSVSNDPGGQVVETVPKAGCATTWCTDTADFFLPGATRTKTGSQFYKARFWNPDYQ